MVGQINVATKRYLLIGGDSLSFRMVRTTVAMLWDGGELFY